METNKKLNVFRRTESKCGGCGQAVKVDVKPLFVRYSNLDSGKAHKCSGRP